jgi:hypothetical protein
MCGEGHRALENEIGGGDGGRNGEPACGGRDDMLMMVIYLGNWKKRIVCHSFSKGEADQPEGCKNSFNKGGGAFG